jgi:hypothetical protein
MSGFDLYILKKYLFIPLLVLCIPILWGPALQCMVLPGSSLTAPFPPLDSGPRKIRRRRISSANAAIVATRMRVCPSSSSAAAFCCACAASGSRSRVRFRSWSWQRIRSRSCCWKSAVRSRSSRRMALRFRSVNWTMEGIMRKCHVAR